MKYYLSLGLVLTLLILLLAACGGGTNVSSPGNTNTAPAPPASGYNVVVTITDSAIQSSITTFSTETPYHFTVTNKGSTNHGFDIRQKVQGPQLTPQTQQGVLYRIDPGQLPPGATKSFTFTFPIADLQSHLQFASGVDKPTGAVIVMPINVKKG